jgi:2-oxoglutarate dehydrogenase E2 component (dihydrolipoamide succinyltransferase)
MSVEIRVPTLGESVTEATVATWFKKPGDLVAVDEMLCELETDKVTVEVPSPAAGTLAEIVVAEGETVGVDALLATLTEGVGAAPAPADAPKATAAAPAPTAAPAAAASESGSSVDVMVPTLGESVTEATVSTWFKAVGDTVALDEMLCELETDKVSVEPPKAQPLMPPLSWRSLAAALVPRPPRPLLPLWHQRPQLLAKMLRMHLRPRN